MYELTLPFIGTINLMPYIVAGVLLLLVWDHIPGFVSWAVKKIIDLGSKTITGLLTSKPTAPTTSDPVVNPASGVSDSLSALQRLTVWAVHEGSAEVLGKITALYGDFQKTLKDQKGNDK